MGFVHQVPKKTARLGTNFLITSGMKQVRRPLAGACMSNNKCDNSDQPAGIKWNYTTGNTVASSPAIGADGTVYIGIDDGGGRGVS